ncbi:MAG: zinc ABC transporter substrate-binding protein [Firmicutes bacterium]|nr:zinc ABC transporter substrate-binding protein [Bacillota bacterium]
MKRLLSTMLSTALMIGCLSACGTSTATNTDNGAQSAAAPTQQNSEDKLQIVTTIFPEYDWVKQILGDNTANTELTLLLDNGVDLHSYQPTAEDILKISTCDMFVYVGGESDEWVEDALAEATNKNMKVINLMEIMGDSAKEEEVKEGMEAEEEEEHECEEEIEYDEHVWLSVKNAEILCDAIADDLCEIDPDNAEIYKANLDAYTQQLDTLDKDFSEIAASAENKTLIFGDRFPFRYFVDDYDLDYYAAFVGCSAETEASFETIAFLSGKLDEFGNDTVYTIENSDGKIAQAIIDNSTAKDQKIAVLDSMQSTTSKQIDEGVTYLSVMQGNYGVLSDTLK